MFNRKGRYADGARLSAKAFAADPKLATDLKAGYRYDAACFASLASVEQDHHDPKSSADARAKLRIQARDWLKADLALHAQAIKNGKPEEADAFRKNLAHWKVDADLAPLRDPVALTKIPEVERAEWQTLWAEVERLLAI